MVQQARNYFVGAMSGATLIAIAIGIFVILVSAQVFHDWPIANLGFQHSDSAVAPAKALPGAARTASTAPAPTPRTAPTTTAAAVATPAHPHHAKHDATGPARAVEPVPDPSAVGDQSSTGDESGTTSSPTSSPGNAPSTPSPEAGSTSASSTASSGTGNSATGSSSSGGKIGTAGGSPVTEPVETVTSKPPAQAITETVNGTVSGVDETVLGGTLKETGVTELTENVVNGVAGPESPVGKTVDGLGETVNGLVGGGGH